MEVQGLFVNIFSFYNQVKTNNHYYYLLVLMSCLFQRNYIQMLLSLWIWFLSCNICPVHSIFRFSYFGQNDQKRKNQLYCLCLKMTADFGNFVAKTDKNEGWNEKKQLFSLFNYSFSQNVTTKIQEMDFTEIRV